MDAPDQRSAVAPLESVTPAPTIVIADDPEEAGAAAAVTIADRLRGGALGIATGSSPLPVYRALRQRIDLRQARAFALDEYLGLSASHPQSYLRVSRERIAPLAGLTPELICVPGRMPVPAEQQAAAFERELLDAGGIDVQILGIGANGHLAFNEPGSGFDSVTREVDLAARTRWDNSRFFDSLDATPSRAITQGLATIMRARSIVLVAFGAGKADALARAFLQEPEIGVPASILQGHPDVTIIADAGAWSQSEFLPIVE